MTNYNLNINNPQEIANEIINNTGIDELKTAQNSDFSIALINGISVEFYKLYNKLNYARNILDPSQLNGKTLKDWKRLSSYYGVNYNFKRADTLKITVKSSDNNQGGSIKRLSHKIRYNGDDFMFDSDINFAQDSSDEFELNYFKYDGIAVINRQVGAYDKVVLNNNSIYENKVFVFIDNGTSYEYFENLSFEDFIIQNNNNNNNNNLKYFTLKKDVNGFYNIDFSHRLDRTYNVSIVYFTYSDDNLLNSINENNVISNELDNPIGVTNQYTYEQNNIIDFSNTNYVFFNVKQYDLELLSGFLADSDEDIYNKINNKLTNISPLLSKSFIENYLLQNGYIYNSVENFFSKVRIFTELIPDASIRNYITSIAWPNSVEFGEYTPINLNIIYKITLNSGIINTDTNTNPISQDIIKRTRNINRKQRLDKSDLVFIAKQNEFVDDVTVQIKNGNTYPESVSVGFEDIIDISNIAFEFNT